MLRSYLAGERSVAGKNWPGGGVAGAVMYSQFFPLVLTRNRACDPTDPASIVADNMVERTNNRNGMLRGGSVQVQTGVEAGVMPGQ